MSGRLPRHPPRSLCWKRTIIYGICRGTCVFYCFLMAVFHGVLGSFVIIQRYMQLVHHNFSAVCFGFLMIIHLKAGLAHCCGRTRREEVNATGVRHWYQKFFGTHGPYGRRGKLYEYRLSLREIIEIPVLSYQGLQLSCRISDHRVPLLFALVVFADTFGVLVIMLFERLPLNRRTYIILLDISVDLLAGALIPMYLLIPIISDYFSDPNVAVDRSWGVQALSSVRFLMVTSTTDLLFSLIPLITSHFMLNTLHQNWTDMEMVEATDNPEQIIQKKAAFNRTESGRGQTSSTRESISHSFRKSFISVFELVQEQGASTFHKLVCLVSLVFSVYITFLALQAKSLSSCDSSVAGGICMLQVYPWNAGPNTCHCLFIRFQCEENPAFKKLNSDETLKRMNSIINEAKYGSTLILGIMKCPIKDLPASIEKLDGLDGVVAEYTPLRNITIDLTKLERLMTIVLQDTQLQNIPFATRNVPERISTIRISYSNLQNIPEWTADAWKGLYALDLSFNQLSEVPPGICEMRNLNKLWLDGNEITSLPECIGRLKQLKMLGLSGNKLRSIPRILAELPKLRIVVLAGNNISSVDDLPWTTDKMKAWTTPNLNSYFLLTGNPLCINGNGKGVKDAGLCKKQCSATCNEVRLQDLKCHLQCNYSSCNFDNGACIL